MLYKEEMKMKKHRRQFKRKIPILRISLIAGADYSKICEVPEFKDVVMNELVIAIKDGINKNKKIVELFEISNTKLCISIEKENWKTSLNTAMEYFTNLENYSKCIECRDLIKQL